MTLKQQQRHSIDHDSLVVELAPTTNKMTQFTRNSDRSDITSQDEIPLGGLPLDPQAGIFTVSHVILLLRGLRVITPAKSNMAPFACAKLVETNLKAQVLTCCTIFFSAG